METTMTLLDYIEQRLAPALVVTCCVGCGQSLGANYEILPSGLRLCSDCLSLVAARAGWYDDEDLHQSNREGWDDGRREAMDTARTEVSDLLEPPEGLRERIVAWVELP